MYTNKFKVKCQEKSIEEKGHLGKINLENHRYQYIIAVLREMRNYETTLFPCWFTYEKMEL